MAASLYTCIVALSMHLKLAFPALLPVAFRRRNCFLNSSKDIYAIVMTLTQQIEHCTSDMSRQVGLSI